MDFLDQVRDLAQQARRRLPHIQTEEATKTSLVLPFIRVLGYETENPLEVVPEFTADVGTKKGEKVDYAICRDSRVVMLFECKWSGADLDKEHASQLFRYFAVTDARFGVLTNGLIYRFFADLEQKNRMDARPFLEFDLLNATDPRIEELKRFTKDAFDPDAVFESARTLKYTREIKRAIGDEFAEPSADLVRFFASKVYSGNITAAVKEQFVTIVKGAFHEYVGDRINDRLKSALSEESPPRPTALELHPASAVALGEDSTAGEIVTTPEEMEAFFIVKALLRDVVDVKRIAMRDRRDYCAVLLDDTNRKPICRFFFNTLEKSMGVYDEEKNMEEAPINELDDIYRLADRLKATVRNYEKPSKVGNQNAGSPQ